MLGYEELTTCVEAEDLIVKLLRDISFFAEGLHSGIRDHDVQAAEMRNRFFEEARDLRGFGYVRLNCDGFAAIAADLLDDAVGRGRGFRVVDYYAGATAA